MIGEEALEEIFVLNKELPHLNDLVSAFEKLVVYFYVIGSGLVEFMIQGKNVGWGRGEGEYFGDCLVLLLRNYKRAATCVVA